MKPLYETLYPFFIPFRSLLYLSRRNIVDDHQFANLYLVYREEKEKKRETIYFRYFSCQIFLGFGINQHQLLLKIFICLTSIINCILNCLYIILISCAIAYHTVLRSRFIKLIPYLDYLIILPFIYDDDD